MHLSQGIIINNISYSLRILLIVFILEFTQFLFICLVITQYYLKIVNQQLKFYNNLLQMIQIKQYPFVYCDSSEDEDQQLPSDSQSPRKKHHTHKLNNIRPCHLSSDQILLNNNHLNNIQRIVQENMHKIQSKAPLLIQNNEKQILQNLQKRTLKYKHFLKQLNIDKKYKKVLQQKSKKLNLQNQRKKIILQKNKIKQKLQEQENQLQKYALQKKQKQIQAKNNIQKFVQRQGMQLIRDRQKIAKDSIKKNRNQTHKKLTNLQIKQNNELDQLRQKLQKVKTIKKVNELDQKRVIKDLVRSNQEKKNDLIQKCGSSKQFKI